TNMAAIGWSRGRRGRARADRPSRPGRHDGSRGREAGRSSRRPPAAGRRPCCVPGPAGRARTPGPPSCPYGRANATRGCSGSRCGARSGPGPAAPNPRPAEPEFNAPAMAGRVLSELADARDGITLVIDDLHELNSPDALAQLTPLLVNLPPGV